MKKLIVGLLIAFTMMVSVPISNVFAGGGKGQNPLPEPPGLSVNCSRRGDTCRCKVLDGKKTW